MILPPERVTEIEAQLEAAWAMIRALCAPTYDPNHREWRMSIPVRPDYDPDVVIGAALKGLREVLAERQERPDMSRCLVTGNPVGSDTRPVGQPCGCSHCRIHQLERERQEREKLPNTAIENKDSGTPTFVPNQWTCDTCHVMYGYLPDVCITRNCPGHSFSASRAVNSIEVHAESPMEIQRKSVIYKLCRCNCNRAAITVPPFCGCECHSQGTTPEVEKHGLEPLNSKEKDLGECIAQLEALLSEENKANFAMSADLEATRLEVEKLQAELATLGQRYKDEYRAVTKIWEALGNPKYPEETGGKAIWEIVAMRLAELAAAQRFKALYGELRDDIARAVFPEGFSGVHTYDEIVSQAQRVATNERALQVEVTTKEEALSTARRQAVELAEAVKRMAICPSPWEVEYLRSKAAELLESNGSASLPSQVTSESEQK